MTDALPPPRTVDNGACTGEVHDQGAQVTRWAPAGADPVLYVSTALRLERGRVDPRRGAGLLAVVRARPRRRRWSRRTGSCAPTPWHLVEASTTTTTRRRSPTASPPTTATSPHWPHRVRRRAAGRFGRTLEMSLTTTNTGDEPFDYEEALHAYLVVGDIRRARIDGLDGKSFFDKVTGTERVQQGDARPSPARRMPCSAPATPSPLHDPALGRRLVVTTEGAAQHRGVEPLGRQGRGGRRHR